MWWAETSMPKIKALNRMFTIQFLTQTLQSNLIWQTERVIELWKSSYKSLFLMINLLIWLNEGEDESEVV